jgi:Domain of unknown function (DUF3883)
MQAIRYGDQPEVRARLTKKIDQALDINYLKSLLNRNALAQETMSAERLFAVKEQMEKAEARRLQPYFVRAFFLKALDALGGTARAREAGRYEVTYVPAAIRERDRRLTGRNRREFEPVLKRYDRICFEREAIQPVDKPGLSRSVLMHPGYSLMLCMSDMLLEQHMNLLRQGAILVDPADDGMEPWLLFLLTHEVKSGDGSIISKRLQFVRVGPQVSPSFAGWAPHLDLEPLPESERSLIQDVIGASWITADQEARAVALAAASLVPEHFNEVATRRIAHVEKTLVAVHERLTKEIDFWQDRWMKLKEDQAAGKDVRLNLENVRRTISDLEGRLESRKKELQVMRHVVNGTPVVLGGALVVPAGLMQKRRGDEPVDPVAAAASADAAARSRIEHLAMEAVRRVEEAQGCKVVDVSADKCGWDLTSYPPALDGKLPEPRHIEVKGRVKGAGTVCVTRNEILYAFNQGDKFVLAVVLVGENDAVEGPHYIRNPFDHEPGAHSSALWRLSREVRNWIRTLIVNVTIVALAVLCSAQQDARAIIEHSVEANGRDWAAASDYEYLERDREPSGGTKTFEDLLIFGSPYQRLVGVNGKPLSPKGQAEEQRKLKATIFQRRSESERERAERIAKYKKDRNRDHLLMEQLTKAFNFALVGEQNLDGYNVYVLKATPRAGYQPPNMEAEALRGMQGKLWIDKKTFQWVKVEAQVIRPVSIEGFLAEVEPGTRFELEKMAIDHGIWLPKHYAMKSNARVLLFFSHKSQEEESYYGYRKPVSVEQLLNEN